jgi:hypothetical protein
LFLAELVFAIAGPERTKNLAGEVFRLIQDPFNVPILKRPANLSRQYAALPKCRFDFHKRSQLSIRPHNEALPVAISINEDRSPFKVEG